jgi:hypothetical protein
MGISLCRGGSSANRYILIRHSARSDLSLLDRKEESGLIATKPQPISQRVGGTAIRGQHARILLRFTPEGGLSTSGRVGFFGSPNESPMLPIISVAPHSLPLITNDYCLEPARSKRCYYGCCVKPRFRNLPDFSGSQKFAHPRN